MSHKAGKAANIEDREVWRHPGFWRHLGGGRGEASMFGVRRRDHEERYCMARYDGSPGRWQRTPGTEHAPRRRGERVRSYWCRNEAPWRPWGRVNIMARSRQG